MDLLPAILLALLVLALGILGGLYGPQVIREIRDEILDVISNVDQRLDSSIAKVRMAIKRYIEGLNGRVDNVEQELQDLREAVDKLAEAAADLPDPDDDDGPKRLK